MEKIKTILGIITIGFLIYLYIEHFPDIARSIQRYLLTGFSSNEEYKPSDKKVENRQKQSTHKNFNTRKEVVKRSKSTDMFQPIDEYERKAEEEIDKLLELK